MSGLAGSINVDEVRREDPGSPEAGGDTSDKVFMVSGGRWQSSQATCPELKMCLKAA